MLFHRSRRMIFAIALGMLAATHPAPVSAQSSGDTKEATFAVALLRVVVAVAAKDNALIEMRIAALPDMDGDLPRAAGRWLYDFTLGKPGLAESERALTAKLESAGKTPPLAAMRAMKFFDRGISAQEIRELSGGGPKAPKSDDLVIARLGHGLIEAYRGKDNVMDGVAKDIAALVRGDDTSAFRDLATPEGRLALAFAGAIMRHGISPLPELIPVPRDAEIRQEVVLFLDLVDGSPTLVGEATERIAKSNGIGACIAGQALLVTAGPEAARPIFDALVLREKTLGGPDAAFIAACAGARGR